MKVKRTEVHISVFNEKFSLRLDAPDYMSYEQCLDHLHGYLEWPTATIIYIKHGNMLVYHADGAAGNNGYQFSHTVKNQQRVA